MCHLKIRVNHDSFRLANNFLTLKRLISQGTKIHLRG